MGCHLLCNDGLGRCMSIFVYIIMFLGMLIYTLTILVPALGTDDESKTWVEFFCYTFFWSMMLISHLRTMCSDPGFIPFDYAEYREEVLVTPFKSLLDFTNAYEKLKQLKLGVTNAAIDEERVQQPNNKSSSKLSAVAQQQEEDQDGGAAVEEEAMDAKR